MLVLAGEISDPFEPTEDPNLDSRENQEQPPKRGKGPRIVDTWDTPEPDPERVGDKPEGKEHSRDNGEAVNGPVHTLGYPVVEFVLQDRGALTHGIEIFDVPPYPVSDFTQAFPVQLVQPWHVLRRETRQGFALGPYVPP